MHVWRSTNNGSGFAFGLIQDFRARYRLVSLVITSGWTGCRFALCVNIFPHIYSKDTTWHEPGRGPLRKRERKTKGLRSVLLLSIGSGLGCRLTSTTRATKMSGRVSNSCAFSTVLSTVYSDTGTHQLQHQNKFTSHTKRRKTTNTHTQQLTPPRNRPQLSWVSAFSEKPYQDLDVLMSCAKPVTHLKLCVFLLAVLSCNLQISLHFGGFAMPTEQSFLPW